MYTIAPVHHYMHTFPYSVKQPTVQIPEIIDEADFGETLRDREN
jgi:hypothetical protein